MSLDNSWFTEAYRDSTAFSVRFTKKIYDSRSEFQRVEIFDTPVMGKVLILEGCFMVTEKDSFIYHEMLVHPAMRSVAEARKVLVIGGGDAGAVTEIVKYPHVESVILCEIDPMVVEVCKEHFPDISAGLKDTRVKIVNEDGAKFIKQFKGELDIVLVDSTDPVGPGTALYESAFYRDIKEALRPGGVAAFQTESPLFMPDVFSETTAKLKSVFGFDNVCPYLAVIPSYPGGLWSFGFCSNGVIPVEVEPSLLPKGLKYYTPEIHKAAFALPPFVISML